MKFNIKLERYKSFFILSISKEPALNLTGRDLWLIIKPDNFVYDGQPTSVTDGDAKKDSSSAVSVSISLILSLLALHLLYKK